jgi:hypothetical protein
MTPELNLAAIALLMFIAVAAYCLGYDEGRDIELRRNRKRQRHRQRLHREEI